MKIDLKKLEILEANSEETLCFSARLYIDGAFAATVHNDGQGGANRYYFEDNKIRDEFFSYCRALPDFDSPYGPLKADEDLLIGDLIEKKLSVPLNSCPEKHEGNASMKAEVRIKMDAMATVKDPLAEFSRILRSLAHQVDKGVVCIDTATEMVLRDSKLAATVKVHVSTK